MREFRRLPWLLGAILCCSPSLARGQRPWSVVLNLPDAPGEVTPMAQDTHRDMPAPDAQLYGTVAGTIVDGSGNAIPAGLATLAHTGYPAKQAVSDSTGRFVFTGISAGPFQITVDAMGFATRMVPGALHMGEALELPALTLAAAGVVTDVQVNVTREQLAEEQIRVEEKQRVFGALPNFYVTYDHHALPMSPRQKFEMAWRSTFDPVNFIVTGVVAGVQQANDSYSGYGQGAQGYAKRYGADYADGFIGDMIGNAILPVLFKQDPRYFWKGTGTVQSRVLYAIANAVVRKGDNGKWQPDYSGILGGLASGGISNLYYPAANRDGAGLTFENTLIGTGTTAIGNLFQEFLIRKLTPHARVAQP